MSRWWVSLAMVVSNLLDSICNPATSCTDLCHKWPPGWSVGMLPSSSHPSSSRLHVAVQLWAHALDDLWRWRDGRSCCRRGTWLGKGGLSDGVWMMDGAKGSERGCILHWPCSSSERLHAGVGRGEHQARTRILWGERRWGTSTMEQLW